MNEKVIEILQTEPCRLMTASAAFWPFAVHLNIPCSGDSSCAHLPYAPRQAGSPCTRAQAPLAVATEQAHQPPRSRNNANKPKPAARDEAVERVHGLPALQARRPAGEFQTHLP